jgi:hypothetical protein
MGIFGGAQGVFSYANKYAKGTPCDTGWASFKPKYEQVWPWIMNDNRTLLITNITSGTTQYQNPVMNVKLKITRFCNWLQSL